MNLSDRIQRILSMPAFARLTEDERMMAAGNLAAEFQMFQELMPHKIAELQMVALRNKRSGDLDNYIFRDEAHAIEWLTQKFVTDARYGVDIVRVAVTPCCHKETIIEVLKQMTVSEYLATAPKALGKIGRKR
jgi:hypothetical protein